MKVRFTTNVGEYDAPRLGVDPEECVFEAVVDLPDEVAQRCIDFGVAVAEDGSGSTTSKSAKSKKKAAAKKPAAEPAPEKDAPAGDAAAEELEVTDPAAEVDLLGS